MKKTHTLLFIAACLLVGGTLVAQGADAERAAVNLSKPGQPALLKVSLLNGGITVKVHNQPGVIVESRPQAHRLGAEAEPDEEDIREQTEKPDDKDAEAGRSRHEGMKRIGGGAPSLTVEERDNVVMVEAESWKQGCDLTIYVPQRTSLKLHGVNGGSIQVEGVEGEIEAENVNGSILLQRISGSVMASTTNGKVVCSFARVDPGKPMAFATFNGDVDVTFPADLKADIRVKTQNGEVYSDFDVSLRPDSEKKIEDKRAQGGRYRIVLDKAVVGVINGGGATMKFQTFNGDVLLRKAK